MKGLLERPRALTLRATDGTGTLQVGRPTGAFPDGATGYHTVSVTVLQ